MSVILCQSDFGRVKNPKTNNCEKVEKFTWKTPNRLQISLITFGAMFTEIKAPDRDGNLSDILLGYDESDDCICKRDGKFNFNRIIGPVSGIIKDAEYCIKGKFYELAKNLKREHCVDSGAAGLHQVNWTPFVKGNDLTLSHTTDGSEEFPAILLIQCVISVTSTNKLTIKMTARSNKVSPIDLSYRFYFNLSSHDAGEKELLDHLVTIKSSEFSVRNENGVFKKNLKSVEGCEKDLNELNEIRQIIAGGEENFDCLYKIDGKIKCSSDFRAIHAASGRILDISSNQKFLHFSSCPEFPLDENSEKFPKKNSNENLTLDYLRSKLTEKEIAYFKCRVDSDKVDVKSRNIHSMNDFHTKKCHQNETEEIPTIIGKNGSKYCQKSGFSISCHNFPNAVNHQHKYPEILIKPGQVYENILVLKFGVHVFNHPSSRQHPVEIGSC